MAIQKLTVGNRIELPSTFIRLGFSFFTEIPSDRFEVRLFALLIPKYGDSVGAVFHKNRHSAQGEIIMMGSGHHWMYEIDLLSLLEKYERVLFILRGNGSLEEIYKFRAHFLLECTAETNITIELNTNTILNFGELYIYNGAYKFRLINDVFSSEERFCNNYSIRSLNDILNAHNTEQHSLCNDKNNQSSSWKNHLKYNVGIIGARHAGKSSLVALIHDYKPRIHSLVPFRLNSIETDPVIKKFLNFSLRKRYEGLQSKNTWVSHETTHSYRITPPITGILSDFFIDLEFTEHTPENHLEETVKFIRSNDIIILAIHTPYLMEEHGAWHETINVPRLITDAFKHALINQGKKKLILLVPVKCEYYIHDGDYLSLLSFIQKRYAGLLNFLQNLEKEIAVAITPVQTLGNIHLADTEETAPNQPPKFIFKRHPEYATYSPRYGDQLLTYILSFIFRDTLNTYSRTINKEGINLISRSLNQLLQHRKQGAEGYKIIQGFELLN